MRTYARIDGGVVRELFATAGNMEEMFHPAIVWVDVTDVAPRPTQDWSAVKTGDRWTFSPPFVA